MKSGEKKALWLTLAAGVGVLGLTVYLEAQHQQHEARLDKTPEVNTTLVPSTRGLDARVIPSGLNPAAMPDPDSRGATLLTLYCAQCHELPTPLMHSASEWPAIIDRMQYHIKSRHSGMLTHTIMPPQKDWQILRSYMQEYAQISLEGDKYTDLNEPAGQAFQSTCSQCHDAPSPEQHNAREWPRVVLRMKGHMQKAGKAVPDLESTGQIVNYLQKHSREEVPKSEG